MKPALLLALWLGDSLGIVGDNAQLLLLLCCWCCAAAAVLRDCNPAALQLTVVLGIDGNAQHATATARHGMRPSVVLVVSPSLPIHGARRG